MMMIMNITLKMMMTVIIFIITIPTGHNHILSEQYKQKKHLNFRRMIFCVTFVIFGNENKIQSFFPYPAMIDGNVHPSHFWGGSTSLTSGDSFFCASGWNLEMNHASVSWNIWSRIDTGGRTKVTWHDVEGSGGRKGWRHCHFPLKHLSLLEEW